MEKKLSKKEIERGNELLNKIHRNEGLNEDELKELHSILAKVFENEKERKEKEDYSMGEKKLAKYHNELLSKLDLGEFEKRIERFNEEERKEREAKEMEKLYEEHVKKYGKTL